MWSLQSVDFFMSGLLSDCLKAPQTWPHFQQETQETNSSVLLPVLKGTVLRLPSPGNRVREVKSGSVVWGREWENTACLPRLSLSGSLENWEMTMCLESVSPALHQGSARGRRLLSSLRPLPPGLRLQLYWLSFFRSVLSLFFWYQLKGHLVSLHSLI